MRVTVTQTQKGLYDAHFTIVQVDGTVVGSIRISGQLGSMEGAMEGDFKGMMFSLNYVGEISNSSTKFRPYSIDVSKENKGFVYQTVLKQGLFKKVDYTSMGYSGQVYDNYPIGLGVQGSKGSIYCKDQQVALVEKDCLVQDDLHIFEITAIDLDHCLIAVVFSCYAYITGFYKPGMAVKKGVEKNFTKTMNAFLKEKYDPNFKDSIVD